MKKPIEILAEVSHTIKNGSEKSVDELERLDCILFAEEALEAMKIAMKEGFNGALRFAGWKNEENFDKHFDEWFNKLEEKK